MHYLQNVFTHIAWSERKIGASMCHIADYKYMQAQILPMKDLENGYTIFVETNDRERELLTEYDVIGDLAAVKSNAEDYMLQRVIRRNRGDFEY